jgi:hypothetical protein
MEKLIMYLVNYFGLNVNALNTILGGLSSSILSISSAVLLSTADDPFGAEDDSYKGHSSSLLVVSSSLTTAISVENVKYDLKDLENTTAYIESLSPEELDNLIAVLSSDIELNNEEVLTRKLTKNS